MTILRLLRIPGAKPPEFFPDQRSIATYLSTHSFTWNQQFTSLIPKVSHLVQGTRKDHSWIQIVATLATQGVKNDALLVEVQFKKALLGFPRQKNTQYPDLKT